MTTSDSITFTSQNTPENIEEAWREDMVKTFNKILNSCREQRYKNDDGQSIDENLVQYTSMIFKNISLGHSYIVLGIFGLAIILIIVIFNILKNKNAQELSK